MAQSDITTIRDPRLRARLDVFFARLGQGFNAYIEARGRSGEINRLNAMSDAELKKLGITRDRIPEYVFRDIFHI